MLEGRIGTIGRFKPLQKGSAAVLDLLCQQASHVQIGIGSSNKYDMRNPFTALETQEMIEAYLHDYQKFSCVHIPDFGHIPEYENGERWRSEVNRLMGQLDWFVTGNLYVRSLLGADYPIMDSVSFVDRQTARIHSTTIRIAMAKGENWEQYVPEPVTQYIKDRRLDERFRQEFGALTLQHATEHFAEQSYYEQRNLIIIR